MTRVFNVTGSCDPKLHYMVDITDRLKQIKVLVDQGAYFTINRARQYGKTTTLRALSDYLKDEYVVLSFDFQRIGNAKFATEHIFALSFVNYLKRLVNNRKMPVLGLDCGMIDKMAEQARADSLFAFDDMFPMISDLCDTAEKPVVMLIDEVDSAANNQVFLDFLAQLRSYYLDRNRNAAFQSVILAGVYDVKNMKLKLRPEAEHKMNSPWNIAADFPVDMSFSARDIRGMLEQYEKDYHTGMDIVQMAEYLYDSTSGYPFLVSRLCQLMDERIAGSGRFPQKSDAWTKAGYTEAEKLLVHEKNTLFESLTGKLVTYPELKKVLKAILFDGKQMSYAIGNQPVEMAAMLGFIKNADGTVAVANRIFETVLYNLFLSEEEWNSTMYEAAVSEKNQFIRGGHLDMKLVLERFVAAFTDLYGDKDERFLEEAGRKYFMLFLRPIINGTGHSYVEARTRNLKRTDIVVDYRGEQFVVELKIWRGAQYYADGEAQIAEYLDYYGLKRGYLLTFSFNRNKQTGVREVRYGDRILVEAIV